MSRICRTAIRQTVMAGFIALSLITAVAAQTVAPAAGLGQAWPNAKDHSRSPYWHVYVFERDGVRYIQINDWNGTVHAALGHVGDTIFALPIGVDAEDVMISTSSPAQGGASALAIYQDDAVSVMAEPQTDGATGITVQLTCSDPKCIGGSFAN